MSALRRSFAFRFVAILLSSLLFYSAAFAGVNAIVGKLPYIFHVVAQAQRKKSSSHRARHVAGVPTHFSRDAKYRGGVWNDRTLLALRHASLTWGATPQQVGAVASLHGGRPGTTGDVDGSGGSPYPWEGRYSMGLINGYLNTNTGNLVTSEPLFGFKSLGQSGVALTLFHNSQTTFNNEFGFGWSCNYDARIVGTKGHDVVVRWGDGTAMAFTYNAGNDTYSAPVGIHDQLLSVLNMWLLIKPDQTGYTFNSLGQLTQIADPNGNATSITYGPFGIAQIIAADFRTVTFTYDSATGLVSSVTSPGPHAYSFVYDVSGQLKEIWLPAVGSTIYKHKFTYDGGHRIATKTDANGKIWSFGYGFGPDGPTGPTVLRAVITPLNEQTSFFYTTDYCMESAPLGQKIYFYYTGGKLTRIDNPNLLTDEPHSHEYLFYNANDNLTKYTDHLGRSWTLTYDGDGNCTSITNPLNQAAHLTYNSLNEVDSITDAAGNNIQFAYDSLGNLLNVRDPVTNAVVANMEYDAYGQITKTADVAANAYVFGYDSNGNLISVENPNHKITTTTYNAMGIPNSITDPLGRTRSSTIDSLGRPYQFFNSDGVTHSVVSYDGEGHVIARTDENNNSSQYHYDGDGHIDLFTDGRGNHCTFDYDDNGRMTTSTDFLGHSKTYQYWATGKVWKITNTDGVVQQFTYDPNGDVASYLNGPAFVGGVDQTTRYQYNENGQLVLIDYPTGVDTSFEHDIIGRLWHMTDSQGMKTLTYDRDSRLTKIFSAQSTVDYTYDATGRRTSMTRAPLGAYNYEYDPAGNLTKLTNPYGQVSLFNYFDDGALNRETLANNSYTDFSYDNRGRLSGVVKRKPAGVAFRTATYSYFNNSLLQSKTVDGALTTYGYDQDGELTSETSPSYIANYSYDANGNRTSRSVNGATDTYNYSGTNDRLASVSNSSGLRLYAYDALGRTSTITAPTGAVTTFHYDYNGNVTSINYPGSITNTFLYNGLGARMQRTDTSLGTKTYVREGLSAASDVLFDGARIYTPGISEHAASGDQYYNGDGLGNLTDMTDASGNLYLARTWDAYGVQKTGGVFAFLHGYGEGANYEEDKDGGLKLCGARYYDPSIGRFLSPDPAGVGSNLYAYCGNNPTGNFDPSGLISRTIFDGVGDDVYGGSSDNDSGWNDGTGLLFTHQGVIDGLETGCYGARAGLTFGLAGTGGHENDLGFNASRNFGRLGGIATIAAAAPAAWGWVVARFGAGQVLTLATAGTAAAEEVEQNPSLALGVREELTQFAADRGAMTWKAFVDNPESLRSNWQSAVEQRIWDANWTIHFNLNGIADPVESANSDFSHMTSEELRWCRDFGTNVVYWRGGQIVPNPFGG